DGPAVLPEVLADDGGDVDAVHADDGQPVAAHEDAVLVEHAVVGEVVLGRPHQDLAAVQPRRPVERRPGGLPRPDERGRAAVEVADDDGQVAEALVGEPAGEALQGAPGRLDEGRAQGEVLDRKSTRLNSSHVKISYAVICLKKKKVTR